MSTAIQWTDETWNPTRGCSVVSPGCVNCYAMKQAHRFSGLGKPYYGLTKQTSAGPQWTGRVVLDEQTLLAPLHWKKPRRVFVNSMSDLFHDQLSDEDISRVFAVMALCPQHTFQVLTKRADRMRAYLEEMSGNPEAYCFAWARETIEGAAHAPANTWPLPNVWLGVSVEDQLHADRRIPLLLQTPAAVRFISAEPLLGPIDLWGARYRYPEGHFAGAVGNWGQPPRLDWVIVGGESGPGARPCDVAWVRSIVEQCREAGVACFVKQLGAHPYVDDDLSGFALFREADPRPGFEAVLRDKKGGEPWEWPIDLQVREYPEVRP